MSNAPLNRIARNQRGRNLGINDDGASRRRRNTSFTDDNLVASARTPTKRAAKPNSARRAKSPKSVKVQRIDGFYRPGTVNRAVKSILSDDGINGISMVQKDARGELYRVFERYTKAQARKAVFLTTTVAKISTVKVPAVEGAFEGIHNKQAINPGKVVLPLAKTKVILANGGVVRYGKRVDKDGKRVVAREGTPRVSPDAALAFQTHLVNFLGRLIYAVTNETNKRGHKTINVADVRAAAASMCI